MKNKNIISRYWLRLPKYSFHSKKKRLFFVDSLYVYKKHSKKTTTLITLFISFVALTTNAQDNNWKTDNSDTSKFSKTFYNSRTHRFSSSELRQRTYESELRKEKF